MSIISKETANNDAQMRAKLLDKMHNQVDKIIDKLKDRKICQ